MLWREVALTLPAERPILRSASSGRPRPPAAILGQRHGRRYRRPPVSPPAMAAPVLGTGTVLRRLLPLANVAIERYDGRLDADASKRRVAAAPQTAAKPSLAPSVPRHAASRRQRLCTGPGPQPQPRPRMSPEEFQRAVFTNGPNTGNEAQVSASSRTPFVAVMRRGRLA